MHDLILFNGRIVTLDAESHIAEALAVKDGHVAGAGRSADLLAGRGRNTRVIDLAGKTVCPGFFDAHAHMDREGLKARGGYSLAGRHSIKPRSTFVDGLH